MVLAGGLAASTALLLAVVLVLTLPYVRWFLQPSPPTVCMVNLANNPRTASLFSRGMLEQHGSANTFAVVTPTQGCHPASERVLLVTYTQLLDWCLGSDICVITGDEECHAPAAGLAPLHEFLLQTPLFRVVPERTAPSHLRDQASLAAQDADDDFDDVMDDAADEFQLPAAAARGDRTHSASELQHLAIEEGINLMRPNVILREFYSSKYNYPAVALGARFEFQPVTEHERDAGNRKYLFNFMGSIKVGQERDREHLRDVLNAHNWTMPIKLKMFDALVRNPDQTTADEYRATLLSSSFTLAPVGTADDCFRFWEAIEAGSIPIYVRRMGNLDKHTRCPDAFEDVLAAHPPIVLLGDWDELPAFAEAVTEPHIEELRRNMVVWARDWWSRTARTVDEAISRALAARAAALALPEDELTFRTEEVTAALSALREQQRVARAGFKTSEEEKRAERQQKAAARVQKKAAEVSQKGTAAALQQQLRDDIEAELHGSPALADDQTTLDGVARLEALSHEVGDGAVAATAVALRAAAAATHPPGKLALDEQTLKRPTFEWLHAAVVGVLRAAGGEYRPGGESLLTDEEYDLGSVSMRYPINRATFLNKVITAVAADLDVPPVFVKAQSVLDRVQPERTRLFACLLAKAAAVATGGAGADAGARRRISSVGGSATSSSGGDGGDGSSAKAAKTHVRLRRLPSEGTKSQQVNGGWQQAGQSPPLHRARRASGIAPREVWRHGGERLRS